MSSKITSFKEFKVSELICTAIQPNKENTTQDVAFINYGGNKMSLNLQTPWIKLDAGGVPRVDDYHTTEKSRACIKIPFNNEKTPDCIDFYNKMNAFDNYMISPDVTSKLFGKKANKYKYSRSIYEPPVDEDKEPTNKPPTMKCRIKSKFNKNDVTEISTKVFHCTMTPENTVSANTEQEIKTIDDLGNKIRFRDIVRLIIVPNKIWIAKTQNPGADKILYGVTWQAERVQVQPMSSSPTTNNNNDFLDEDEEVKLVVAPVVQKKVEVEEDDEEEEEDEEDDEEEEPEPIPEPPKKAKKAPVVEKSKAKK